MVKKNKPLDKLSEEWDMTISQLGVKTANSLELAGLYIHTHQSPCAGNMFSFCLDRQIYVCICMPAVFEKATYSNIIYVIVR